MNTFKAAVRSCLIKPSLNSYIDFGRSEMRSRKGPQPYFIEGFSLLSGLSFSIGQIEPCNACTLLYGSCSREGASAIWGSNRGGLMRPSDIEAWHLAALYEKREGLTGDSQAEAVRNCVRGSVVARSANAKQVSPDSGGHLSAPLTIVSISRRPTLMSRRVNGPETQKALLLQFWKRFGGKPNRASVYNYPIQEKLQVLVEYSRMIMPYDCQIPLKVRRERFNKNKHLMHPFRKFGRCFACGLRATDRHHIIQLQNGGINSKKNLVSLCKECHEIIHPEMTDRSKPQPQTRWNIPELNAIHEFEHAIDKLNKLTK